MIVADCRFSPRNLLGSVEIRGSAEVYEGLKGSMNLGKLEATMGRGSGEPWTEICELWYARGPGAIGIFWLLSFGSSLLFWSFNGFLLGVS